MKRTVILVFVVLTCAKLWVATRLDPFGDEAFYWQCGQRPAIAYADHPPMTAMWVRLGTEIAGNNPFGVRLLFLLAGIALPWVVFHVARPLVGPRDAWMAAGAALALPAVAHLGLLAIPDAPMMLLTALFLGGVERATRTGRTGFWLFAGFCGALGLATHYRFVLAPAAAILYLVLSPAGRRHWRGWGPWLMLVVMLPGLVPAMVHNLRTELTPLTYYLAERHSSTFRFEALLEHLTAQAILVTPLLYVAVIGTLVMLCRRALAGDDRAQLVCVFALVPLGTFLLASPFENSELSTAHWPAPGYLPLLPFVPSVLRLFVATGRFWRRVAAMLAPCLGAGLLLLVLIELGTGWLRLGSVREPFIGGSEVADRSHAYLAKIDPVAEGRRIVVADNYKLGARLELHLHDEARVYVLDHHKNRQHGRAPQLAEWGIDEAGLRHGRVEEALVVLEASQIRTGEHDGWVAHAASFFEHFERLGELQVESPGKRKKKKVFWFYLGRGVASGAVPK